MNIPVNSAYTYLWNIKKYPSIFTAVAQTRESTCTKCSYIKPLEPSGFISSYHTQKSGCGSPDCPWRLEARPGQRINISLVNFAWTLPEKTKPSAHPPCKVYATIKEVSGSRGETICGENIRERHVYTSLTSAVELRIVGKSGGEQHLFQYEGEAVKNYIVKIWYYFILLQEILYSIFPLLAIGCGEPVAPSGGWMEQRGDTVKVGCPGSKRAWILKCSDGLNWASSDAVPTACEGTIVTTIMMSATTLATMLGMRTLTIIFVVYYCSIVEVGALCGRCFCIRIVPISFALCGEIFSDIFDAWTTLIAYRTVAIIGFQEHKRQANICNNRNKRLITEAILNWSV